MGVQKRQIIFEFEPDLFIPDLLPYLEAKESIQLYTGNRGSGKTTFFQQRAIIFALTKNYFRLVYCRKTAVNIRDSLFQTFKDIINEWNLQKEFHIKEHEMDIRCKRTGNMLLSFGLDKPEKLKGISDPSHILWDEMTEGNFQDYSGLIGLLRTKKVEKTQFWGGFNPEFNFWGREYFFEDSTSDEIPLGRVPAKTKDTLIYKATFKKNPFINIEEYELRLKELARGDENKQTVWIDGNWGQESKGNEYFTKFKSVLHMAKVPYLPNKAAHLTFDFNTVPYMTMLAAQVVLTDTEFQIRIFREYCLASPYNTTIDCCKAFLEDYKGTLQDVFYYGDASGNNKIAGKGNVTAFDDVRAGLRNYLSDASRRVLKVNPSVMKRRDFMNDILAGLIKYHGLKVVLIVDESCKETKNDLAHLKLGDNGKFKERVEDKVSGITYEKLGHTSDALEYLVISLLWDLFKNHKKE